MNMREQFEAWFEEEFGRGNPHWMVRRCDGYLFAGPDIAWDSWKAATRAALERAADICKAYSEDQWSLYKGRPPYTGQEEGRADADVQGRSSGADVCEERIRALMESKP